MPGRFVRAPSLHRRNLAASWGNKPARTIAEDPGCASAANVCPRRKCGLHGDLAPSAVPGRRTAGFGLTQSTAALEDRIAFSPNFTGIDGCRCLSLAARITAALPEPAPSPADAPPPRRPLIAYFVERSPPGRRERCGVRPIFFRLLAGRIFPHPAESSGAMFLNSIAVRRPGDVVCCITEHGQA